MTKQHCHGGTFGGIENIAPATQKGSRVTIVAKHLHLPHKKEVGSQATFRSVPGNFSEASKILRLPHKVSVSHLRLFPTSRYRVRGEHLRGIEIVAPATQNPWQGSQIGLQGHKRSESRSGHARCFGVARARK